MAFIACVAYGIPRGLSRFRDHLRLLVRPRMASALDADGHDSDGPEHGRIPVRHGTRPDVRFRGGPTGNGRSQRFLPTDILGAIALVGLLLFILIRGMDPTAAAMLSGLFGVLFGRMTKTNGVKP